MFPLRQYQGGEKNLEHFGSVYYTTDVLGSVRGISNEEGTVASIYEYSAFGDLYQGDSTLSYGMAYTGKQEMRGLEGIYNYGYRDYRAVEGRFSTEDPIKDGTNWYVYVGNSPLNFVDPLGLASESNSYSLYGPPSYATREPAPPESADASNHTSIPKQKNASPGDVFCDGHAWNAALDNDTNPRGQNGEEWNANEKTVDKIYDDHYKDNRHEDTPPPNTKGYVFTSEEPENKDNPTHMEYYEDTDGTTTEWDTGGVEEPTPGPPGTDWKRTYVPLPPLKKD